MKTICCILLFLFVYADNVKAQRAPTNLTIQTSNRDTELLLETDEGKRIGYDFMTKEEIRNIEGPIGGYIHDVNDNDNVAFNEIFFPIPRSGLYKLTIYANKDSQFDVEMNWTNEIMRFVRINLFGKLQKGEVQNVEILYSETAAIKTTVTKVLDLNIYEREATAIFKNDTTDIVKIKKMIFDDIHNAKNTLKKDPPKAKTFINCIVDITTQARKEFLIKSCKTIPDYKFDHEDPGEWFINNVRPHDVNGECPWEWYDDNVIKYDILIIDAKELIKQIR